MEFGDDEDEGERGSGRSGSAEIEMDMDMEEGEEGDWKRLALGSGSGGVKGRRKGMVFKCEHCSKVSHNCDQAALPEDSSPCHGRFSSRSDRFQPARTTAKSLA